jgi:hypothetical protein
VLGRVVVPDMDKVDLEDPRSFLKYARKLTDDVHRGMQDATDEANAERSKMSVSIPFFPKREGV